MAEDKKDIKISFCGYNKNTTVGEIRKDFENLETAKSKVNEYRKTKYQNANEEKLINLHLVSPFGTSLGELIPQKLENARLSITSFMTAMSARL